WPFRSTSSNAANSLRVSCVSQQSQPFVTLITQRNGEQIMNYNDQKTEKNARVRRPLVTALVLGCAFGTVNHAAAQKITPPPTPILITPPAGNSAFLVGHAFGTQGCVCLPKGAGASWTVNNARPEATLFTSFFGQDIQIITHF